MQPFVQCTDTDGDSGISTYEPIWILYSTFKVLTVHYWCHLSFVIPTLAVDAFILQLKSQV